MAGYLVARVQGFYFLGRDMPFITQKAAVQMKRAFDAVPVEDVHQLPVISAAIVVAHGERLVFPAGIAAINLVHAFFLLYYFIELYKLILSAPILSSY